jgi:hypothetical protein
VNCNADETRRPVARAFKVPQTLGPIFLAGLRWERTAVALSNAALITAPLLATLPTSWGQRAATRTHVSTTEPLDSTYRPALPVGGRYADLFCPTMLTDPDGTLSPQVAADVEALRVVQPRSRLPGAAGG